MHLPDLVAFVLVADGQQVEQDFVEISKGEVYTHDCNCITRSHLRAEDRAESREDTKRRRAKKTKIPVKHIHKIHHIHLHTL